ncbi:MAG: CorA family divalent cation transporter, partial [Gammaproteobacteria bacterium]
MNEQPFILYSYVLDERGGGTSLGANSELEGIINPYWVHLDATSPDTNDFLKHSMALPMHVVDGLLADESRPRCDVFDNGILVILRGVNLNPGANPEDMVSLRIWLEENRVITTRFRRIMAVEDIVHQ